MTPAEHAAVVEEWVRSRVSILDGPESRLEKSKAGRASLAALVAQAERAERALREIDVWITDECIAEGERMRDIARAALTEKQP